MKRSLLLLFLNRRGLLANTDTGSVRLKDCLRLRIWGGFAAEEAEERQAVRTQDKEKTRDMRDKDVLYVNRAASLLGTDIEAQRIFNEQPSDLFS